MALTDVERIKAASSNLRGTLEQSLNDPLTGALATDDTQLSKFHGIYQQDDRDSRSERKRQRLEPAYSFMIRARVPGGLCTPAQWLNMDRIATKFANESIRLTTRQAFQLHGVIKRNLKNTVAEINSEMMDTLAACGDVNRNVMAPTLSSLTGIHEQVQFHARELSDRLTPATHAYHEIWLDGEKLDAQDGDSQSGNSKQEATRRKQNTKRHKDIEPIYGDTYLPRKFKTAFVVPPQNDTDVFAQDLGFIAIVESGRLVGYNVTVGGGMGMSHGEPATYPRLGSVLGFVTVANYLQVAEAVVTVQRDFGDRTNRKHARLKYTIDDRGVDWLREEVEARCGFSIARPRPYAFAGNGDTYGWQRDDAGLWHYLLFIENGRVSDNRKVRLLGGLRAIAEQHTGEFRLTPNQNIAISGVADNERSTIDALLRQYGIENARRTSALRLHSMACVAFPTCGLAMAESERYLPSLIDRVDAALEDAGLADDAITIRMTGCPNGCARPYIAEIGLVGKGPGHYNLYLGAGFAGDRLNALYRENINEKQILDALLPLFNAYANERESGERFGDFCVRKGVVREISEGRYFHEEPQNE